ncbi:hypothetical protein AB434_0414 [Heyndrickxia coagulans]|uniref:Uncharacterized protein n=1 Tax=Heyndrickxia coagulans TaxID=1398 RepID=A0AAN0T3V8_HEYCO|nr:hypothetical protein SB48_HM08orf01184 [Heyndrickxia coagulans]AKN52819.1 hypothetical protein AB434_0414 [Heyndrickxia coagulans]KYC60203.1 hypothetical protein B4100_2152 [Heyndrickxia coagulans]
MHDIIILEACAGTIAASGSLSGLTFVPLFPHTGWYKMA